MGKEMLRCNIELQLQLVVKMSSGLKLLVKWFSCCNPGDEAWKSSKKFGRHSRGCKLLKNGSGNGILHKMVWL